MKPTTRVIRKDERAAEPLAGAGLPAEDGGKSRRVEPLIPADLSDVRSSKPSAEMGAGRFYGEDDFPEHQPFVGGGAGRALSSEAEWFGASINGAAGIRCCHLR